MLSVGMGDIERMIQSLMGSKTWDAAVIKNMLSPTHGDVITFVNDMVNKGYLGKRYYISDARAGSIVSTQYLFSQSFLDDNTIYITDSYNSALMSKPREDSTTYLLVKHFADSFDSVSTSVLNPNSSLVIQTPGLYGIISKHLPEFINYLTWSKTNEIMRHVRSKGGSDIEASSTFTILKQNNSVVMDMIYLLNEKKPLDFTISDKKTGATVVLQVPESNANAFSPPQNKSYITDITSNITAYRAGTVDTVRRAIEAINSRISNNMSKGVQEGLRLAQTCLQQGWVLESVNGVDCLVYHDKVYVNHVVNDNSSTGIKHFNLPDECVYSLYMYDITVPITPVMIGLDSSGVKARGIHPHRVAAGSYSSDLENITALNRVCIGDLNGHPISDIGKLIDSFKGAYETSMAGGLASSMISTLFDSAEITSYLESTNYSTENREKVRSYCEAFLNNKGVFTKAETKSVFKAGHIFSAGSRRS